jgi:membrane protease YdiL (CAAX protease family)
VPALRPILEDDRVADIGVGLLAYRALVRIPLGTALLEELAFRGVLFAAWRRRSGTFTAAVGSSLVFGLWHIRPTYDLLAANDVSGGAAVDALAVAAAVVTTAAAGGFFVWLRVRGESLAAPFVAHAGVNALAIVAAFAALRLA